MTNVRVRAVICVAFLGFISLPAAPARAQSVPSPVVARAPSATDVPGASSHLYPFFATTAELASHGYIEEEYFFDGAANRYNIAAALSVGNTPLTTASVIASGAAYRTRMIVRRPASARDFNGTVFIEWQNVTFGFDVDGLWLASSEHIMRRGYAYIGVSVQRAGVNGPMGVRSWSPSRYRTLDVTANGLFKDDSLAYDIFSQAAQAVRHPIGDDPLGGLPVKTIVGVGISQAALYLVAYQNAVHPLAGVFDGFMPLMHGGPVRVDSTARSFKVLTETDVARDQAPIRQENTSMFRRWEVAGSAHIDFRLAGTAIPLMLRDVGTTPPMSCSLPPFSRVPTQFVLNASLDAMDAWLNGIEPPIAPDIITMAVGTLPGWFTTEIVRDSYGNALGGIQLAEHAVPTATNTGVNSPTINPCRTYGTYQPFDQVTLDALYPEHGVYVSQVTQVTQRTVKAGFLVREDAMTTIEAAARSVIGKPQ